MTPQTNEEAAAFGAAWVAAWNRRDIEHVLAHFADDVTFRTPVAAEMLGTPVLAGKAALRAYWQHGLTRIQTIHFVLDHVLFDVAAHELAIVYTAKLDARVTRAVERLRFGPAGLVVDAEALYGAPVS